MALVITFDPVVPSGHDSPRDGTVFGLLRFDDVAFDADHPLDDGLAGVPGRHGHDDVAALDRTEADGQVGQEHQVDRVVGVERRLHGYPVHSGHAAERVDQRVANGRAEKDVFHTTPDSHRKYEPDAEEIRSGRTKTNKRGTADGYGSRSCRLFV